MASQEGSTHEFGGVSPYRCATGACKVAVRASTLAFCAAVGSTPPRREHVAGPAKRMVAGEVPGMGLPAADRPALPLELADHVEHPWVRQPRANSRSEPGPTDRPLRAALACSRLVLCQVPQQNLGKPSGSACRGRAEPSRTRPGPGPGGTVR